MIIKLKTPQYIFMLLTLFILLSTARCAGKNALVTNTGTPGIYNKAGVYFEYPATWNVTEDYMASDARVIYIETPGSAILFIYILSEKNSSRLTQFARKFAISIRSSDSDSLIGESTFGSPEKQDPYEVLTERFLVTFLKKRIAYQRVYRRRVFHEYACTLIAQYALENRYNLEKKFNVISSTFRYSE
ncbi:MAG: hypothetical protein ABUK01_01970 [Leptospirales bacterium]